MAKLPASATSKTGHTLDAAVKALPYHPDAPPKPRTARAKKAQVLALPRPGAQPAIRGAPPIPGSAAAVAPHLAQAIAQAATRIGNTAGDLPAAIAPVPSPTPAPAPAPAPAAAATAPDPYAGLDPEVASLLRGFSSDTEARARAIQAVNDAASGAATTFAGNLTTGLGQLAQLAGTPLGAPAPSDVPANVAALPGVISQQGQQQALAQAAQAVGSAYNLPAQLQAAGLGAEAQFYGGATNDLQTMLSGIASDQMSQQTELAKQSASDAAALQRAQLTANASTRNANVNALERLMSAQIASGDRQSAQQTNVALQQLRNAGSLDVANIGASSRQEVAATNAAARTQAAATAAAAKQKAQTTKPVSSSIVKQVNDAWSGKSVKNPQAGQAGQPAMITQGGISQLPYDQQGPELLRSLQQYGLPSAQMWRMLRSKLTADQVRSLQYANRNQPVAHLGTFQSDLKQAQKVWDRFYKDRVLPGGKPATGSADEILSAMVPALAKLVGLDGAEEIVGQVFPTQALQQWASANASTLQQIQAR